MAISSVRRADDNRAKFIDVMFLKRDEVGCEQRHDAK